MKNGYDQFFQKARKAAQNGAAENRQRFSLGEKRDFQLSEEKIEEQLKRKAGLTARRKKKKATPWKLIVISFLGLVSTGAGMVYADELELMLKNVEVSFMGQASAQATTPATPTPPPVAPTPTTVSTPAPRQPGSTDLDHLSKLSERQKELDARAEELSRQEAELAKMKIELEKRLAELESMRNQISEILAERVKVDGEKVATLVEMYSNMKPPQAAKIFESLDEDLAVELLSRMKKKSAADIMNLLPPEKAQVFSERYAGYKRK